MNNAKIILDKWLDETNLNTYKELAEYLGVAQNTLDIWKRRGNVPEKNILKYNQMQQKIADGVIYIPKLSLSASAGSGNNLESIDAFEKNGTLVIDAETLKVTNYKALKAIKVEGYSMIPMLLPDSWVIFDDTKEFKGDGLYILNWDNNLMVKLVQLNPNGQLEIISVNKEYKSYEVDKDSQIIFRIFGKVVRTIL